MENEKLIQFLRESTHRKKALEFLYQFFEKTSKGLQKIGAKQDQTKDIFQEGILIFYHQAQKKDFYLSCKPSTYLFGICQNIFRNKKRKEAKQNTLSNTDFLIELSNATNLENQEQQNIYKSDEAISILRTILSELGEPCKKLLTGYYVDKFSMKELAQKLGYNSDLTAKAQKYKCLQRAKKLAQNQLENLQTILL
ncbi:RNA polymerase sigma factor, sigma-70 family [Bernardetia litoralis DSM 6794]|uniref:RNA polymerase sigma factor, sigma-70 family n=1 Tax=Bernardetia litoralis (strain ATCC 23117 / DSM 6794 / NBRC 15988 / NCIMB 1366 / Fx l1 / Sio-4) TaxID=880071 RepID=I4AF33_BERLS|nr:sigma-70 family RNA polymerase sigma factor [Bernardetia litoralis]AFM02568.1 RNA polymerase sigma factor, sigma-70 family [Bernardetia litoralis DSM 6794]